MDGTNDMKYSWVSLNPKILAPVDLPAQASYLRVVDGETEEEVGVVLIIPYHQIRCATIEFEPDVLE